MKTYTTLQFSKAFPEPFAALPEPYQNDSCLDFAVDDQGVVSCYPAKGQEEILGRWTAYYYPHLNNWKVKYKKVFL